MVAATTNRMQLVVDQRFLDIVDQWCAERTQYGIRVNRSMAVRQIVIQVAQLSLAPPSMVDVFEPTSRIQLVVDQVFKDTVDAWRRKHFLLHNRSQAIRMMVGLRVNTFMKA